MLSGVRLHYRTILNLNFDRYLTWNAHLDDLAARCKFSLSAIRCISHYAMGSRQKNFIVPVHHIGGIQNELCMRGVLYSQDIMVKKARSRSQCR